MQGEVLPKNDVDKEMFRRKSILDEKYKNLPAIA